MRRVNRAGCLDALDAPFERDVRQHQNVAIAIVIVIDAVNRLLAAGDDGADPITVTPQLPLEVVGDAQAESA